MSSGNQYHYRYYYYLLLLLVLPYLLGRELRVPVPRVRGTRSRVHEAHGVLAGKPRGHWYHLVRVRVRVRGQG